MPIYEYRCDDCGEVFEKVQRITEDPLKNCELCGGPAHRIISRSTFILKGTGWYAQGYSSTDKKANTTSSTSTSTSSSSSTTTSEKKTETSSTSSSGTAAA